MFKYNTTWTSTVSLRIRFPAYKTTLGYALPDGYEPQNCEDTDFKELEYEWNGFGTGALELVALKVGRFLDNRLLQLEWSQNCRIAADSVDSLNTTSIGSDTG